MALESRSEHVSDGTSTFSWPWSHLAEVMVDGSIATQARGMSGRLEF